MYAIVSFPISSYKTFTYRIPEKFRNKILLGTCVNAPINHRIQIGFIVAVSSYTEYKGKILKIDSIIDSELEERELSE